MKAKVPESEVRAILKMVVCTKKWFLIAAVCISTCAMSGCIESTFNLAAESRLPKGIAIPAGLSRDDVSVTLDFLTPGPARFTVRDKNGKKLTTVNGETKSNFITPGPDPNGPSYQLIVINGITEVIKERPYRERENMEQNGRIVALFYVIDDPGIKEDLMARNGMK